MKFWKAHGKQTAHHLIEIGLAAQGCDCPNSQRGNSIGPAPKSPNDWASIKPIVAHPFGGVRDDNDPLPNFASAPGDFVACCQSGPRRRELQHYSSRWSEGAWRHKHQRRMFAAPSTPIAATQMTACPQRRVDRMAQNSILQCQNTEARNREGAQLRRRCS
jgi:hypothetical protein